MEVIIVRFIRVAILEAMPIAGVMMGARARLDMLHPAPTLRAMDHRGCGCLLGGRIGYSKHGLDIYIFRLVLSSLFYT